MNSLLLGSRSSVGQPNIMRLSTIFAIFLLVLCLADAQRRNRNRKNKNRGRSGVQCHLKEVEQCLDSLTALNKGKNPTQIITTSEGLDKICSAIKNGFVKCVKDFFKKCGTPLHREIGGLFVDQVTAQSNKFCNPGPEREQFLKNSPCLHEKVLSQKKVKEECNNRYVAALNSLSSSKSVDGDEAADTVCCGYRFWEDCTQDIIKTECGSSGVDAFQHLIKRAFMGFPDMTCPKDLFIPTSSTCKGAIPPKGKASKVNSDGFGKYNVANMFAFLFQTQ